MGKLIIDGNSVFEIDEQCLKKRKVPKDCDIEKYINKITDKKENRKRKEKQATDIPSPALYGIYLLAETISTTSTTAEEQKKDKPQAAIISATTTIVVEETRIAVATTAA